MLTLLETITAIKSLETEPDVIISACTKILKPSAEDALATLDPEVLAIHIAEAYKEASLPNFMIACNLLVGRIGGLTCEAGKEGELIAGLTGQMSVAFAEACAHRFEKLLSEDPEKASLMISALMEMARPKPKG